MARDPRAASSSDDAFDPTAGVPQDAERLDPLQIASLGLEELDEEDSPRGSLPDHDQATPDPLAVLSLAIDEEQAHAGDDVVAHERRGLFGRRSRGRAGARAQQPGAAAETAYAEESVAPQEADDEPRVTTWAQDFAEGPWATGEWPAVKDEIDAPVTAEVVAQGQGAEAQPAETRTRGSRRGGRRRRRRGLEPVAASAPVVEPATTEVLPAAELDQAAETEPKAFLGSYLDLPPDELAADVGQAGTVEHVVDERWDLAVDGGGPPADFLTAYLEPGAEGDADVVAGSTGRRRLDQRHDEAELAERARLAAEQAEEARLAAEQARAAEAERQRLAAEEAERQRLREIQEAAQRREESRLHAVRVEEDRRATEAAARERAARAAAYAEEARLAAEATEARRIAEEQAAAQQAEAQRLEKQQVAELAAEEQRLAAEQVEADRIESERAAAQQAEDARVEDLRLAALAAEEQRLAAEQLEADRIESERAAAQEAEDARVEDLRLEELRLAADLEDRRRIEHVRAAAEQAARERLAAAHEEEALRAAKRAEYERLERERLEAERAAEDAERAEREWAEAERAEAERLAAEREAAERAEAERVERLAALEARRVAALAEQERLAAEESEEQHRLAEEREQRRQAAFLAQQERIAAARAEKERIAAEQAEWERQARERAARAAAPQAPQRSAASAALADAAGVPSEAPAVVPTPVPVDAATPVRRDATGNGRSGHGTAEPIPRFIEFRPGNLMRYVFGLLFTLFSVGAVIAIFWAVSDGSGNAVLAAAVLTGFSMLSWWALLNWSPPIVSISNGVLELSRGSTSQSWNLRDPSTEVTFRGRRSSPSWRAVVRGGGQKQVTISARMVDASQFTDVVEHYRSAGPETDDQ